MIAFFVVSTSQLPTLSMLVIDFGNQVVLWGVLRKYFKRHAPKYVLYVLICHGVVTNLLYYDVMPEKQNKIIDKG